MRAILCVLMLGCGVRVVSDNRGQLETTSGGVREVKRGQAVSWTETVTARSADGRLMKGVPVQVTCRFEKDGDTLPGTTCTATPERFETSKETTVTVSTSADTPVGSRIGFVRVRYDTDSEEFGGIEVAGFEMSVIE